MTSNPPAGEPEPRWQQPSFEPQPPGAESGVPQPGPGYPVPAPDPGRSVERHVPPPSVVETVVGALRGVIWPVAILLWFASPVGFMPLLIAAIVANVVLGAVKKSLRQRRYAALPPAPPAFPSQPDDLR